MLTRLSRRILPFALLSTSCGSTDAPEEAPPTAVSSEQAAEFDALKAAADAAGAYSADEARAAFPVTHSEGLAYDPLQSTNLDVIQGSALALSETELGKLGEQGLVISTRSPFPTFLRGLAAIYSEHLPLYISADAILEALHSSYDTMLMNIERDVLMTDVQALTSLKT